MNFRSASIDGGEVTKWVNNRRARLGQSGPLYPQELPPLSPTLAAAKGHERTHAPQQILSFDHFVGAGNHCSRYGDAERLCSLKIDRQLENRGQLHRQIRRIGAL
jgi:hypothetical protein